MVFALQERLQVMERLVEAERRLVNQVNGVVQSLRTAQAASDRVVTCAKQMADASRRRADAEATRGDILAAQLAACQAQLKSALEEQHKAKQELASARARALAIQDDQND